MNPDILHDLVNAALAAGADAAEAVGAERSALSVGVRLGALEEVEREEARDLGLRVFVGQRTAVVSGSDISPAARAKLVERAVAMARLAPEDVYAGLAPEDRLAKGPFPDLDLYDPTERSAEALEAMAVEAEDAARAVPGVANSDGGGASWSTSGWSFVTSHGFQGGHRASGFSLSASVIAGEGSAMERGGEGRSTRHAADLPYRRRDRAPGGRAGGVALRPAQARLDHRAGDLRKPDRHLDHRPVRGRHFGHGGGAGRLVPEGQAGRAGVRAGRAADGQPVPPARHGLGRLRRRGRGDGGAGAGRGRDVDHLAAQQRRRAPAWLETTGHASRGLAGAPGVSTHNLTVEMGSETREALMKQAGKGLFVTSMFGPSLNGNTGDWSVGVSGFWFEDGEIAYPVSGVTVAANLIELYARMIPANDLEIRGSSNSPSLFVDGLAIAGK